MFESLEEDADYSQADRDSKKTKNENLAGELEKQPSAILCKSRSSRSQMSAAEKGGGSPFL